jgi:iron complex transport system substrate-binding protein
VALVAAACGDDDAATTTAAPPGTGGGGALPVTYTGADGVESLITDASRIVTLSGEFTEIVFALGLGDDVVGVDLSSVYPEEVEDLPKVGVERLLLAEPIIAQNPTVVLGDVDATPVEVIDQVRQTGIPVVIFPRYQGVDAPATKIREVARVLGIPETGDELAASVQDEIDAVVAATAAVDERPPAAVVYLANRGATILLLGDNTVMEGLLEAAGATDVAPAAGADGMMPLTPEALAGGAPEHIITTERGIDATGGLEGFLEIPGVGETPAAAAGNILVFEDLYLLGLGPRTGQLLRDLATAFHPDLTIP